MTLFSIQIDPIDISDRLAVLAERFLTVLEGGQNSKLDSIERKIDQMALNLDKINAGLDALKTSQDDINAGIAEVAQEVADLKATIGDNAAAQTALDSIGDSLSTLATKGEEQAKALRDINPDTPATA